MFEVMTFELCTTCIDCSELWQQMFVILLHNL